LYRRFVLADVPAAERQAALNLRVQQWSPFTETGRYVVWEGDHALVWIWDDALRREMMNGAGVKSGRVLPETVLHPRGNGQNVQFLSCLEGVEAQVWKNGALWASRWWENAPPQQEWVRFLLANDLDPALEMPPPAEAAWLRRPWAKNADGRWALHLRAERLWVTLAAAVFAFLFIWQGATLWHLRRATDELAQDVAVMTEQVEPQLAARGRAIEERQAAEQFLDLIGPPAQLDLMAAITEKLPPSAIFIEWDYNQGHLAFTVQGEQMDPRYFVKAYQALPLFENVSAERGRRANQLLVEMDVRPHRSSP
jgi:hypothetical protein